MKKNLLTVVVFALLVVALLTVAATPLPNIHLASAKFIQGKGLIYNIHIVDGNIWRADLKAAYITVNHVDYKMNCFFTATDRTSVRCEVQGLQFVAKYPAVIHIAGANLATTILVKPDFVVKPNY
jgi:hypothetical protein